MVIIYPELLQLGRCCFVLGTKVTKLNYNMKAFIELHLRGYFDIISPSCWKSDIYNCCDLEGRFLQR